MISKWDKFAYQVWEILDWLKDGVEKAFMFLFFFVAGWSLLLLTGLLGWITYIVIVRGIFG